MEAKDTVKKAVELCNKVCHDHRSATLEAKDCTGLDCEECQLEAQAEISFKAGELEGYGKGFVSGHQTGRIKGKKEAQNGL